MIIGFDAKRLFHNQSGLGSYSRSLVRYLARRENNLFIHLYTPRYEKTKETKFFEKQGNVVIHELPFPAFLWRSFFLFFWTKKHNLDVFHGLSGELPLFSLGSKVKKVLTIHDVIFKSHPQYYSFWDRLIYNIKSKKSLKKADTIIAISNFTKGQIQKYYGDHNNIKVVPPVINDLYVSSSVHLKLSEFKKLYNLHNGYFLVVGSLKGRKNVEVIISALSLIEEKKRKKVVFITQDDPKHLLKVAKEKGVSDWTRVEQGVNNITLSLYYKYCNALIFPSLIEGFGLPILEALAHGVEVICSDHPSLRETGGDRVIYFDPNNFKELSKLLTSLSHHERKRDKATLSHLNTFNPKLICSELMYIYARQ